MQRYKLTDHLQELKSRFIKIICFFLVFSIASYHFNDIIYSYLLAPLPKKFIYTGLAEAFFTQIKISIFVGFCLSVPVISFQIYQFIAPGLYESEKKIALIILSFAPILFFLGGIFVFYIVIPGAWHFFLSFESLEGPSHLVLEPKISEYLDLVINLIVAFGAAFELPIILMILSLLGIITKEFLSKKRRIAVVIIFVIAGFITPPDVISQIALAMPMVLLYEISIILCKLIEIRRGHA